MTTETETTTVKTSTVTTSVARSDSMVLEQSINEWQKVEKEEPKPEVVDNVEKEEEPELKDWEEEEPEDEPKLAKLETSLAATSGCSKLRFF